MVALALHDEPADPELMPAADEQGTLLDQLPATAEVATRLMAPADDRRHVASGWFSGAASANAGIVRHRDSIPTRQG